MGKQNAKVFLIVSRHREDPFAGLHSDRRNQPGIGNGAKPSNWPRPDLAFVRRFNENNCSQILGNRDSFYQSICLPANHPPPLPAIVLEGVKIPGLMADVTIELEVAAACFDASVLSILAAPIDRYACDGEDRDEMFLGLGMAINDDVSAFAVGVSGDEIAVVDFKSAAVAQVQSKRAIGVFVRQDLFGCCHSAEASRV
jgi:hypothetical protein